MAFEKQRPSYEGARWGKAAMSYLALDLAHRDLGPLAANLYAEGELTDRRCALMLKSLRSVALGRILASGRATNRVSVNVRKAHRIKLITKDH
jgi:hypothetical protein